MEKLLNLPYDSLTKEIALTEELMELFIKYQIPSDLLSFDGNPNASVASKLQLVKTHVKAIQEMIEAQKKEQLVEKKEETLYQNPELFFKQKKNIVVQKNKKVKRKTKSKKKRSNVKSDISITSTSTANKDAPTEAKQETVDQGKKEESKNDTQSGETFISDEVEDGERDYTKIPEELDGKFAKLDEDASLRPTIINAGLVWRKRYKEGLLSEFKEKSMGTDQQKDE